MNKERHTAKIYGFLWKRADKVIPPKKWHFDYMQESISEPIVRGSIGIEVGSGSGYDTYKMAHSNPLSQIVSAELSDGVYNTKNLTSKLKNVVIVKCSALDIPIKDNVFDFAYSFGVLHHTDDPNRGLSEIVRVLKKQSPVFLYLYEDHSENPFKFLAVRIISLFRKITVKIPPGILYFLCWVFSPFVFIIFTLPSRFFRLFRATERLGNKIPFNFGRTPFALRGDLYDRFRAPIEHRFSRKAVYELFAANRLTKVNITRLNGKAGWVAWGYKE